MMFESKRFTNPFPGLRPFETEEYRLFFGREGQSDALITRLQRARFLAVVGTSGSGKSSLVRAGLLPALRGGMMATAGSGWRICIMRPGSDPFGNLAHSLAEKDVLPEASGGLPPAEAEAVIDATLRCGSLGLVNAAQHARLAEHQKLLIVVDQFEELFRFKEARKETGSEDDAAAFVKLLLEASAQGEVSIYVVLTMRSDFLGDCAQFQGLPEAINDGQYLIPRMTRDERRMAITGPVGVTRGKMTEPLINRLLNDVGDNPDQLPILQHALMRTWDYWQTHHLNGEPIGLEHYEAIGTMSAALSLHAEEAWNELPDEHSRHVAEKLFKALTEKGADNREIRRPTQLSEISAAAEARQDEVVAVIEVFRREGRSFLMPPVGVELLPDTVIDISHESLIRNWDRLQKWVEDEAQSARIYRRLAEAAILRREGSEGLLQDPALQIALDWREHALPNAAWGQRYHPEFDTAIDYLDASRRARDAASAALERQHQSEIDREQREIEQTRAFAEQQARAARRLRWAAVAMTLLFLFAAGGAVYAFALKQRAQNLADKLRQSSDELQRNNEDLKKARVESERQAGIAVVRAAEAEDARRRVEAEKAKAESKSAEAIAATKRAEAEKARAEGAAASEKRAREEAQTKAAQLQKSMDRADASVAGLEDFQRGDFRQAKATFEKLTGASERPIAVGQPIGDQGLTSEQSQQLTVQLGWAYSKIGSTQLKLENSTEAVDAFETARAILEKSPMKDAAGPVLLDTYSGLADAYHGVGLGLKGDPAKKDESYRKAEQFYQAALDLQKEHMIKKHHPQEVLAPRYANLARLYVDTGRFDKAEENFKLAVNLRRLGKNSSDLKSNERAALVAALRELAEFYQGQGRSDDAILEFNEMIVVQEDITVGEIVNQGQEIAISYADLAQIHTALADGAKADLLKVNKKIAEAADAAKDQAAKDEVAGANAAKTDENATAKANLAERATASKKETFHTQEAQKALRASSLLHRTAIELRQMAKSQGSLEEPALVKELTGDLDDLGDTYSQFGKFPDAEAIYLQALEYRGSIKEEWKSYDKLAQFYRENKKDPAKAGEYEKLLKLAAEGNVDILMQLGEIHSDDPDSEDGKKSSDAAQYYKDALAIYKARSDWNGEDRVLVRLSKLYLKQKRTPERQQVQRDRMDTLAEYFKQLVMKKDPLPKAPASLVSEYLYAINAIAYGNKNSAEAEALYKRAVEAYDYITSNIDDKKVLDFYAATLEDYQKLLNKLGKPDEAEEVAKKAKVVREKLR